MTYKTQKSAAFLAIALIFAFSQGRLCVAQLSGSRGTVHHQYGQQVLANSSLLPSSDLSIEKYMQFEGKVELRLKPDQIRIIVAITAEGETSSICNGKVAEKLAAVREGLSSSGVDKDSITDDFISVLPRYTFEDGKLGLRQITKEVLTGYRMQTNLHIRVANEKEARSVIGKLFEMDVTDIIGFDYGSEEMEAAKLEALAQAAEKAKQKSALLLTMFDEKPRLINVRSTTQTVLPQEMYRSFRADESDQYVQNWRNDRPVLRAFRPKNTYYSGYEDSTVDRQPKTLPMNCEISIVGTVKLFYESPAAAEERELKLAEIKASETSQK